MPGPPLEPPRRRWLAGWASRAYASEVVPCSADPRRFWTFVVLLVGLLGEGTSACRRDTVAPRPGAPAPGGGSRTSPASPDPWAEPRRRLADRLARLGIADAEVLRAMRTVPRHEFVPEDLRYAAHENRTLPLGEGQTISEPYIVALMTELAHVDRRSRVLEIGTGSGYQAAVLAEIAEIVYSIEIVEPLASSAADRLARLGYRNIRLRVGDGFRGWPDAAPFDAILVTAAPAEIPAPLRAQLAMGGRLVIPVGTTSQNLRVVTRTATGYDEREVAPVRFVPMTGEAEKDADGGR